MGTPGAGAAVRGSGESKTQPAPTGRDRHESSEHAVYRAAGRPVTVGAPVAYIAAKGAEVHWPGLLAARHRDRGPVPALLVVVFSTGPYS